MRNKLIRRRLKIAIIGSLAVVLFGFLVMSLWNWLVPAVFGARTITFWQALGLLLLARILVGFGGGPGRHRHWRRRMEDRWEEMTPEEREKFRQGLRERCAEHRTPAAESGAPAQ